LSDPRYAQTGKEEKISTTSIASDQAARAGVSVSMHQLTDPIALERKGIKKRKYRIGTSDFSSEPAMEKNWCGSVLFSPRKFPLRYVETGLSKKTEKFASVVKFLEQQLGVGSNCNEKIEQIALEQTLLRLRDHGLESVRSLCGGLDIEKERDSVSSSKEVADSVRLDPWRAGNCPVCFG
jgi:hypothetical protein